MTRNRENEIIKSVLRGKTDAFSELVSEYESGVYNLALRLVKDADDAQDIAQDSFIKAYSSLSSFRGDAGFKSWIYRICVNTCKDFLRRKASRQTLSLSLENEDGEDTELELADESFSPEALLERKLTKESLEHCLSLLSEEHRTVLVLREINGLSYDEIAETLSIESGTVKSRIARARKKLCSLLIRDGNIPDYIASKYTDGGERT